MTTRTRSQLVILGLLTLALAALLAGCSKSIVSFQATIEPNRGHVPFQAIITAHTVGDSYTFHLPSETIIQAGPSLEVTIDTLDWTATVDMELGGEVYSDGVHATGSNAAPEIYGLTINGIKNRWHLTPSERTLLEFSVSAEGDVIDVDVWGSEFPQHYSIFIAPYDGDYHAVYLGHRYENACIVYPMYASIPGEVLPYAPTGLETGYPVLIGRVTNIWSFGGTSDPGEEVPVQQGYVKVTAEGPFGQRTTRTFLVPIHAVNYEAGG